MEFSIDYGYTIAGLATFLAVYLILRRGSAIRDIPGPPSPSWIFGHMLQLELPPQYGDYEFSWQKKFGPVYRLRRCFGQNCLMVSDPIALQYILKSVHFDHSPVIANLINMLNVLMRVIRLGEVHRRIRGAMNPGFTATAVGSWLPSFRRAAQRITERLEDSSPLPIDVCPILSTATLSAVSDAVLGCSLEDLGEDVIANNCQLMALTASQTATQILFTALGSIFPAWLFQAATYLPTATFKVVREATYLSNRIGQKVVMEKLEAWSSTMMYTPSSVRVFVLNVERSDKSSRKALTCDELAAQTALFLIAGQDTTANTLAFGLLELGRNCALQDQLRSEIHSTVTLGVGDSNVAYDAMPLLNAFIKEILRVYPAECFSDRVAVQDTVIPLAESIVTAGGEHITAVPIRKGQILTIAIASYHRLEPQTAFIAPGLITKELLDWSLGGAWMHMNLSPPVGLMEHPTKEKLSGPMRICHLTFLSGPHTCLGWRFAYSSFYTPVFICELVGKFSFSLPEDQAIRTSFANTLMPTVSTARKGAPLYVTRI
ncbi:cytochrome P450 [Mycena pura]|uniref:Cytochrome P450 n=1 Tax=Mycena pura TaxID=153505 RepID=A0AAD6Y990_9AGAR|nr:cytochrome P450 [Mycena pura]